MLWCGKLHFVGYRGFCKCFTTQDDLKSALISGFFFQNKQISGIAFHRQDPLKIDLPVATFRLVLTPPHSLILANKHKYESTQKSTAFLKMFNFTATFYLYWKKKSFTVIKVSLKQLSCYGEGMFQPNEYKIRVQNKKNGSFVVNKTGEVFLLRDYTLIKEDDGNIALCRKLTKQICDFPKSFGLSHHNKGDLQFCQISYYRKPRRQHQFYCYECYLKISFIKKFKDCCLFTT